MFHVGKSRSLRDTLLLDYSKTFLHSYLTIITIVSGGIVSYPLIFFCWCVSRFSRFAALDAIFH